MDYEGWDELRFDEFCDETNSEEDAAAVVTWHADAVPDLRMRKQELDFLLDVLLHLQTETFLYIQSCRPFDAPEHLGSHHTAFLYNLSKRLYKGHGPVTISHCAPGGRRCTDGVHLKRVLGLDDDSLVTMKDFVNLAPMFYSVYDWNLLYVHLNTSLPVHRGLYSLYCVSPPEVLFFINMSSLVAHACCDQTTTRCSFEDLGSDVHAPVFQMTACCTALRYMREPITRSETLFEGYYLSQRVYNRTMLNLHRELSKTLQSSSMSSVETAPAKVHARVRNWSEDRTSYEHTPTESQGVYILNRSELICKTKVPSVDMAWLFPEHRRDKPNADGVCRHNRAYVRCTECDKTARMSIFDLNLLNTGASPRVLFSRTSICFEMACVLCTNRDAHLGANKNSSYLSDNKMPCWNLSRLTPIVLPNCMISNLRYGGHPKQITEHRLRDTTVYRVVMMAHTTFNQGSKQAGDDAVVGGVHVRIANHDARNSIPILHVGSNVTLQASFGINKSTSFYPDGIQIVPHPLCGPALPYKIHAKHTPCAERKKKRKTMT